MLYTTKTPAQKRADLRAALATGELLRFPGAVHRSWCQDSCVASHSFDDTDVPPLVHEDVDLLVHDWPETGCRVGIRSLRRERERAS